MRQLLILFVVFVMVSCNDETNYDQGPGLVKRVRAKVLENGMITYCFIDSQDAEKEIYVPGDTVWLNMQTHMIDDTTENTMKVVLE